VICERHTSPVINASVGHSVLPSQQWILYDNGLCHIISVWGRCVQTALASFVEGGGLLVMMGDWRLRAETSRIPAGYSCDITNVREAQHTGSHLLHTPVLSAVGMACGPQRGPACCWRRKTLYYLNQSILVWQAVPVDLILHERAGRGCRRGRMCARTRRRICFKMSVSIAFA
jgi:hypothetical protein